MGLYLLSKLKHLEADIGMYRDDGMGELHCTPRIVEKVKQQILNIFHSEGLKITIDANRKQVNFLDVTLNLGKKYIQTLYEAWRYPLVCEWQE